MFSLFEYNESVGQPLPADPLLHVSTIALRRRYYAVAASATLAEVRSAISTYDRSVAPV
jgi:hypothetical protein